jgi:hypothetical protein
MGKSALLDIEQLIKGNVANAKIIITLPPSGVVNCFIKEDFAVGASAQYGNADETNMGLGGQVEGMASKMMSNVRGKVLGRTSVSKIQTILDWTGTGPFEFELPVVFIATRPEDDVRTKVNAVMDRVFPEEGSIGTYTAPGGYTPNRGTGAPSSVCGVQIGKWFRSVGMLLVSSASFTYSKETISSGNPLYADGTIGFTTYRDITAKDFRGFFPGT